MRGFVVEASSLDALALPEEVLRQSKLHLDIGVTHHKAQGATWVEAENAEREQAERAVLRHQEAIRALSTLIIQA